MLIQKFEKQVKRSPGQSAIVSDGQVISYQELNQYANGIALRVKEFVIGDSVALLFEHGPNMIAAILGVIKAGKIYVPLSVDYPIDRLCYLLKNSEASAILSNPQNISLARQLQDKTNIHVLNIDPQQINGQDNEIGNLTRENLPQKTGYILYTSGSTGKPKGVWQTLENADYYNQNWVNTFSITASDRMTLFSSFCHDGAVQDMFGALYAGATLFPMNLRDPELKKGLSDFLIREKITIWHSVPSLFSSFTASLNKGEIFPDIRYILLGGEALRENEVRMFNAYFPNASLANIYGQTESSVNAIQIILRGGNYKKPVLGTPLEETQIFVVDPEGYPVQPLRSGEILIASPYISPGYWKYQGAAAENFSEDEELGRLYWTGDLGRLLVNGNIEFLGRKDSQVKIRGHRVELGEIESRILQHQKIRETVVTMNKDQIGDNYLCAYFIPTDCSKAENLGAQIRNFIKEFLPDYMVPLLYVKVEQFPKTQSGKIDRVALPKPKIEKQNDYIPPGNKIEGKLVELWSQILGVDKKEISIEANFFELGGHSLRATSLVALIHKVLSVKVPLAIIFNNGTIKNLAEYIKDKNSNTFTVINPIEKKEYYALSSSQKRLFILQQLDTQSTAYNMPYYFPLSENTQIKQLERAFYHMIVRHESLRTYFPLVNELPVQKIIEFNCVKFEIEMIDWQTVKDNCKKRDPLEVSADNPSRSLGLLKNFTRPFDLSQPPIIRVALFEIEPSQQVLFLDMHHIITDGTSQMILEREFMNFYLEENLTPLKLQYKDFSEWQNQLEQREFLKSQEKFWVESFSNEIPVLNLPTDYPRPLIQRFEGNTISFVLNEGETKLLKDLAGKVNATLYMSLLAVYSILLSKLSSQEDIIVGTPISARRHSDFEIIVGMFVNTLAIRVNPFANMNINEYVMAVKEVTLKAYENQEYQFEDLVEKISLPRDTRRNPIFDVMLNLLNQKKINEKGLGDHNQDDNYDHRGISKFDLNLTVVEGEDILNCRFEYSTSIFKASTVERFVFYFLQILNSISENPSIKLAEIDILNTKERKGILELCNGRQEILNETISLQTLFLEQVQQSRDAVAVIKNDQNLSYGELNIKATSLSNVLRDKGVMQDKIVGMMMKRSLEMIIGVFGILKAGGAYLPIDPEYPLERIKYILRDSHLNVLISQRNLSRRIEKLENFGIKEKIQTIFIDDPKAWFTSVYHDYHDCHVPTAPGNLVYAIYTSGSTGRPKGVLIDQISLINRLDWMQKKFCLDSNDVILQKTTYTFDVSVWEIFWWSLEGASVCLLEPGAEKDPFLIIDEIDRNNISVLHFVPSMLNIFFDYIKGSEKGFKLSGIKHIISSGEALTVSQVNLFFQLFHHTTDTNLTNLYGPTEATIDVSFYECRPEGIIDKVPIGKPIQNIQLYIVNKNFQLQAIGIIGELVIAGMGVSRGYLNQPEKTAENFVSSPFNKYWQSPIYRTGDSARWLSDGNIEFLGREDHQVKIRGYRVELGEIEKHILLNPKVKDAVLTVVENGENDKYLCAYYIPETSIEKNGLREYLLGCIPDYMVPSYFVELKTFPLTHNGKVDRKRLPKPGIDSMNVDYVPPYGYVERKLADLWEELLNIERVSIKDNFFRLGGHSLKAAILISKIHKELGIKIPLTEVFKCQSLEKLAAFICQTEKNKYQSIEPVEKKEYYPLSSAQKRLYFIQQMDLESTSYNMPIILYPQKDVEKASLNNALIELINRHESLRTSFEMIDDCPVQRIHEKVEFEMSKGDGISTVASDKTIPGVLEEMIRPFDLSKAPLLHSGLIERTDGSSIWVIDLHHIVSDGTSNTILAEDFIALYNEEGLKPLRITYKDFSEWQNKLFLSGNIKSQEDYWLNLFSGEIPKLDFSTDYKRPNCFNFKGDHYHFYFEGNEALSLKRLYVENGGTLYMIILTIMNILFYKYTGSTDIIIGGGIAGRMHVDLQRIIGMFVNTLAMRNYPDGEKSFVSFFRDVIKQSVTAFENQDMQFEELVDLLELERDTSRNPLFDVMMVVQNFDRVGAGVQNKSNNGQTGKTLFVNRENTNQDYKNTTSKFDMTFFIFEEGDDIYINIEYYTALFKRETVTRLVNHFKKIVKQVIANPQIRLKEIIILTESEKQILLYDFNNTQTDFPAQKCLIKLFKEQADESPNHIAIIGKSLKDNIHVTYNQLSQQSHRLANYLYDGNGLKSEEPVGIMMERSPEMIVGILGILEAGGNYVSISPSFPEKRIKNIIKDSCMRILISEKLFIKILNRVQWECENLDIFLCVDSDDVYAEEEAQDSKLMSRKLWEYVGETSVDEVTGGGWNSSYTGKPISKAEMDEYGDNILKKIEPMLHKKMRVLEIGVASGISMYRIAPKVGFYYGTDLSNVIIEKNKKKVEEEGHRNIKLACLAAHEMNTLEEKNFDLVIINSVIQCFNGHNYLRKILRQVMALLNRKGCIFIGDIMDQDLKEDLIAELVAFKQVIKDKSYKTKIDWSEELFISRRFLQDLIVDYPQIKDIGFSGKIYTLENELTKFRYDALIYLDKEETHAKKEKPKHKYQHDAQTVAKYCSGELKLSSKSGNLAYIIYTSGSTGTPKGVMVDQKAIVRLVKNTNFIDFKGGEKILQTGALEFDASTFEIWGSLLNELTLVLESKNDLLVPGTLRDIIERNRISTMWMTSPFFNQMSDADIEVFNGLKNFLVGGDLLSPTHINRLRNKFPELNVINGYGPTENVTFSTTYLIEEDFEESIPIGKPIANSSAFVLDKNCHLLPPGVPGELYVGGDGLARGYLNDVEMTAEKFVKNPFFKLDRLYRTGDCVKWLLSGDIEFIGRIDNQVKIRGFRIELGEIENQILKFSSINDAVVIDRVDSTGCKYICAYFVACKKLDAVEVREILSKSLPEYMIPSFIIQIEEIPLNLNGKIEKKALPEPKLKIEKNYQAPLDKIDEKLVVIWSNILDIPKDIIGIDDNFFEIGGHSLKATTLTSKIHKEFNVKVSLLDIFRSPTIREISKIIGGMSREKFQSIEIVEKRDYYKLSSSQKRLYILQETNKKATHYNVPTWAILEGQLDKERLRAVFLGLCYRHESLRTSFHMVLGEPVQRINDETETELYIECFENQQKSNVIHEPTGQGNSEDIIKKFICPFNLSRSPLMHVKLKELEESRYLLMVDIHHIITDGTSMEILKKELMVLYAGGDLLKIRIQYKDFSGWQNRQFESGWIKRQEEFWLNEFAQEPPVMNLPLDYPRPAKRSVEGHRLEFKLYREETAILKRCSRDEGVTLFMVILAIYNILLMKITRQEDIVVGTSIAGRRHTDLESVIGMFINTLALRNKPSGEKAFKEFLREVGERTLLAFKNQDYPFEYLVEKVVQKRDITRNPLFDVRFSFHNEPQSISSSQIEIPGLKLSPYSPGNTTSKSDLTLHGVQIGDELLFTFEFCTKLFKEETIQRFVKYFKEIVENVRETENIKIKDIRIAHQLVLVKPNVSEIDLEF